VLLLQFLKAGGVALGLDAVDRFDLGDDVLLLLLTVLLGLLRWRQIFLLRLEVQVVLSELHAVQLGLQLTLLPLDLFVLAAELLLAA